MAEDSGCPRCCCCASWLCAPRHRDADAYAPFARHRRRSYKHCTPLCEGLHACPGIDGAWRRTVDALGAAAVPRGYVHRGTAMRTHTRLLRATGDAATNTAPRCAKAFTRVRALTVHGGGQWMPSVLLLCLVAMCTAAPRCGRIRAFCAPPATQLQTLHPAVRRPSRVSGH